MSSILHLLMLLFFLFFFNDTATTEIYTLSLHDALPISADRWLFRFPRRDDWSGRFEMEREVVKVVEPALPAHMTVPRDRKSTRLNSSHSQISYAVFCLKKKKKKKETTNTNLSNKHITDT